MKDIKICVIGLGYVGLPLARLFSTKFRPLWRASETVGKVISPKDVVVYESTVYLGVTEEECLPVVERASGLKFNVDFLAGYSPERINPGDKEHTVEKNQESNIRLYP